jgi:hypothetical protein
VEVIVRIPKTTTPAKDAANKQNAKKSTGPKSRRGKEFSRRNALKHGILAHDLLVEGESAVELERLLQETLLDYRPVGACEYFQVEIIFDSMCELMRCRRAKVGVVNKALLQCRFEDEITQSFCTPPFQQTQEQLAKLSEIEKDLDSKGIINAQNIEWLRKLPYDEAARQIANLDEILEATDFEEDEGASPDNGIPQAAETREKAAGQTATEEAWPEYEQWAWAGVLDELKRIITSTNFTMARAHSRASRHN